MIISRKRGFIFLRVPRTASTSLTFQIKNKILDDIDSHTGLGYPDGTPEEIDLHHITLEGAISKNILKQSELKSLRIYAVMRDPIDRFISIANQFVPSPGVILSNEKKVEFFLEIMKKHNLYNSFILQPQTAWLIHRKKIISNPIIFPHFNDFLHNELGCDELQYHEYTNDRFFKEIDISQELKNRIIDLYPEDQTLWESISRR